MAELTPEVEQSLADLSDDDWHALTLRVRPPAPGAGGLAAAKERFERKGSRR
ncbi:hypothetical protein ACNQR7_26960 [Mycolicibacterium senegalense]|uniref:hypothetical protein n=1 Tax=Mycolicibacterium TaxID=1866885 RepID=UPI003204A012